MAPRAVPNDPRLTACWPMKPVAITLVEPFALRPKLETWRSETGCPAAFAALVQAASGESFVLPCSLELGTRLEETYAIFQPAFADPTTLSESMLSSDRTPPKLWRKTTAWSFLVPRSGACVTSSRLEAEVRRRLLWLLTHTRAAAAAVGALMSRATQPFWLKIDPGVP